MVVSVCFILRRCTAVQSVRCEPLPCHRQTGAGQSPVSGAAAPRPARAGVHGWQWWPVLSCLLSHITAGPGEL